MCTTAGVCPIVLMRTISIVMAVSSGFSDLAIAQWSTCETLLSASGRATAESCRRPSSISRRCSVLAAAKTRSNSARCAGCIKSP